VPWILEPGGPVRVPLYHTRSVQHSLHQPFSTKKHQSQRGEELTFTTTANTMGPKTMFTFISMVLKVLDNKSRRVWERCFLASGSGRARVETAGPRGRRE